MALNFLRSCMPIITMTSFACGQASMSADDARISTWIDQCKRLNGVEFIWTETQDVLSGDGRVEFSFEVDQTVRVRWPSALEHATRVIETGEPRVSSAAMRFDRDFTLTGSGLVRESYLRHSQSDTSMVGASARRLAVMPVSFAPSLLGVWAGEANPDAMEYEEISGDAFRVHFKELRMRAEVRRQTDSEGGVMMAVTRLESVSSGDAPTQWWEYDDFARTSGGGAAGRIRIWYSVLPDGRIYESMPATLVEIRPVGPAEPGWLAELPPPGGDATTSRPPVGGNGRTGYRTLVSAGPIVLWLGGGVLLIAGVIVLAGRMRS